METFAQGIIVMYSGVTTNQLQVLAMTRTPALRTRPASQGSVLAHKFLATTTTLAQTIVAIQWWAASTSLYLAFATIMTRAPTATTVKTVSAWVI